MEKKIAVSLIFFVLLIKHLNSYNTASPTWIANTYFDANSFQVINGITNGGQTKNHNFNYAHPFQGVPSLVYGIKSYRGNDYLWETNFAITAPNQWNNRFTCQIQLFGTTTLYLVEVQYLAMDPTFPYHCNLFSDVPFEYTSTLTNITTSSLTQTSFTQVIDYTQQAAGLTYYNFSTPLSGNIILYYITSLTMKSAALYPFNLNITYQILNTTSYSWTATVFQDSNITTLRMSQIIFNPANIQSSNLYTVVYQNWINDGTGTNQTFRTVFQTDMMCGLMYFGAQYGNCGLDYRWDYTNPWPSWEYIKIYPSNPAASSSANCGENSLATGLFYLEEWICPLNFDYFNLTTDLCQDSCASYYYYNPNGRNGAGTCTPCYYACYNCTSPNTINACSQCQSGLNRTLVNNTCICSNGYFDDGFEPACKACTAVDPNSLTCNYTIDPTQNNTFYQNIFNQTTWPTDILPNFTSITCITAYFVNSSNLCQACSQYCTACVNYTSCTTCNSSLVAILYTDGFCYLCNLTSCTSCNADNYCVACSGVLVAFQGVCMTCVQACQCQGYYLPITNGICTTHCGDGIVAGLEQCDDGNTNEHDGCSSTCQIETCDVSCLCDGWTHPWNSSNSSCTSICGDGLLRGIEQCDDGNTVSHDGCSSVCTFESCDISCLCDGWYSPWLTQSNMCTTVCGDGLTRGYEQCDLGAQNLLQDSGCSPTCLIIQLPVLSIKKTKYPALALFFLGFRIVGLQALNVLQNFQLVCDSADIFTFKISFNIHGYSDIQGFPFSIPSSNSMMANYNFMFFITIGLFVLWVYLQIYNSCWYKGNKIYDQRISDGKRKELKTGSDEEDHSDNTGKYAVHFKGENNLKVKESYQNPLDESQYIKKKEEQQNFQLTIIARQIFFNLVVNEICVFVYSITNQIKNLSIQSLGDIPTLVVFLITLLLFATASLFFHFNRLTFGENFLKFNKGQAFEYWILMIGEKVVFAAILGTKSFWNLEVVLVLKFALITYYCCSRLYVEHIQKVRSIVTHVLDFLLIFAVIINEHILKHYGVQQKLPMNFMEYVYATLLCIVLVISGGFLIRQIMHNCEADVREIDEQEDSEANNQSSMSAVFDVKNVNLMEGSAQNLTKETPNAFDELKRKRAEKHAAAGNKNIEAPNAHLSTTSLSQLNPMTTKKSRSHIRSQHGSNMMNVLQMDEQNQIEEISINNSEYGNNLEKGIGPESIKIKFNQSNLSDQQTENLDPTKNLPKGFKNYGYNLAHKSHKRRLQNHKVFFKTDDEKEQYETEKQEDGKQGPVFGTDNAFDGLRTQSRGMTFHKNKKSDSLDQQIQLQGTRDRQNKETDVVSIEFDS